MFIDMEALNGIVRGYPVAVHTRISCRHPYTLGCTTIKPFNALFTNVTSCIYPKIYLLRARVYFNVFALNKTNMICGFFYPFIELDFPEIVLQPTLIFMY